MKSQVRRIGLLVVVLFSVLGGVTFAKNLPYVARLWAHAPAGFTDMLGYGQLEKQLVGVWVLEDTPFTMALCAEMGDNINEKNAKLFHRAQVKRSILDFTRLHESSTKDEAEVYSLYIRHFERILTNLNRFRYEVDCGPSYPGSDLVPIISPESED